MEERRRHAEIPPCLHNIFLLLAVLRWRSHLFRSNPALIRPGSCERLLYSSAGEFLGHRHLFGRMCGNVFG